VRRPLTYSCCRGRSGPRAQEQRSRRSEDTERSETAAGLMSIRPDTRIPVSELITFIYNTNLRRLSEEIESWRTRLGRQDHMDPPGNGALPRSYSRHRRGWATRSGTSG